MRWACRTRGTYTGDLDLIAVSVSVVVRTFAHGRVHTHTDTHVHTYMHTCTDVYTPSPTPTVCPVTTRDHSSPCINSGHGSRRHSGPSTGVTPHPVCCHSGQESTERTTGSRKCRWPRDLGGFLWTPQNGAKTRAITVLLVRIATSDSLGLPDVSFLKHKGNWNRAPGRRSFSRYPLP